MCNNLNDFYINIAQEMGIKNQSADSSATHPNIQAIKERVQKRGIKTLILNLSVDLEIIIWKLSEQKPHNNK